MTFSSKQLEDLLKRNSRVTVAHAQAGNQGLCSAEPECAEVLSLDSAGQREGQGCPRFKIVFTVYARRPNDWDNARFKELQDCIVKAGILDDDKWDILEGCVISKKAHTEEEEKTVVEIIRCVADRLP